MQEIKVENIPAYQRKRSIYAKERSLDKKKIKVPKTTKRVRPISRQRRPNTFESPMLQDIPSRDAPTLDEIFLGKIPEIPKKSGFEEMRVCGQIDGYFDSIEVAVIKLTTPLRLGDKIYIEKEDGLFGQIIDSMQIDRKPIALAHSGSDIGLKVLLKPKVGGIVYKSID